MASILPILLVLFSNVCYHMISKSMPEDAHPALSLLITYLLAAAVTLAAYLTTRGEESFAASLQKLNWTSMALGLVIVGLELGWILAYRAGWPISIGSLVANISLAILLIPIGIFLFKEDFSVTKALGVVACIFGLVMINKG